MTQTKAHLINAPLEALSNVQGTPANGQTLVYNATAGKWTPGTAAASGSVSIIEPSVSDTSWPFVSLLIPGTGSNGSTDIRDVSDANQTISVQGAARISTLQSKFGSGSIVFSGTTDRLVATLPASTFAGDWTFECWAYLNSTAAGTYSVIFRPSNDTPFRLYVHNGNLILWENKIAGGSFSYEQWNHVALVRKSNVYTLFLNGVQTGGTWTSSYNLTGSLDIGWDSYSNQGWKGYMNDIRVSTFARYATSFTPPTESFSGSLDPYSNNVSLLLHMNGSNGSTIFTDSSTSARTITRNGDAQISTAQSRFGGASGFFDGNGDFLRIADNAAFDLSSGPFTLEAWIYPTTVDSSFRTVACKATYGSNFSWCLGFTNSKIATYTSNIAGDWSFESPATITANTWHHIALVGDGTVMRHYLNGVLVGTKNRTLTNAGADITIGCNNWNSPGDFFVGFMDEVRLTKGFNRYPAAFTPPTAPFPDRSDSLDPSFSNVSLLLNMEGTDGSTAIADSSSSPKPVTINSGSISTAQKKFGTSSYSTVDGSGTHFAIVDMTAGGGDIGTGDFTIEFWVYPTSFPRTDTNIALHFKNDTGTGTTVFVVEFSSVSGSSSSIKVSDGSSNILVGSGSNRIQLNQWTHVAVTRQNGTLQIWIDGKLEASGSWTSSFNSTYLFIGKFSYATINGWGLPAYYDDLRITKSCRYTGGFTPPSAPFSYPTPALPSPAIAGQTASDGSWLYICTASGSPGTWRRVGLLSF